jgi:hypothetical protein
MAAHFLENNVHNWGKLVTFILKYVRCHDLQNPFRNSIGQDLYQILPTLLPTFLTDCRWRAHICGSSSGFNFDWKQVSSVVFPGSPLVLRSLGVVGSLEEFPATV